MSLLKNLLTPSETNTQSESGCCSLEIEAISDDEENAGKDASDGGCCGSTAGKDARQEDVRL